MKITLDTNCVINLLDSSSATATSTNELHCLVRHALSGHIEIAVTTRVEADLLKDKNQERQAALLRQLQMFPVVGTVARWEVSSWDGGDVLSDCQTHRVADDISKLLFTGLTPKDKRLSNKMNDVDHLVGHLLNRRDVFVTDDRDILRKSELLKASPGIVVVTPEECLARLEHIEESKRKIDLKPTSVDDRYHSHGLRGVVRFDYSNNNHRFSIGDGVFLFETAWSKASDISIHAYNDPPSINAIALAKGAADFAGIRDATAFNFSSRARTAHVGQIVIWRNCNGLYAATKITEIADDGRGAEADLLAFEYIILENGGADFGAPCHAQRARDLG